MLTFKWSYFTSITMNQVLLLVALSLYLNIVFKSHQFHISTHTHTWMQVCYLYMCPHHIYCILVLCQCISSFILLCYYINQYISKSWKNVKKQKIIQSCKRPKKQYHKNFCCKFEKKSCFYWLVSLISMCHSNYPIQSLISLFNCWFDSKYSKYLLFMFYIIIYFYQLTIIKKSQKTKLIPWAGSHEYYVNQNGRSVCACNGCAQYYTQSISLTIIMHVKLCTFVS